jgi:dienelactone hydrolase
MRFREMRLLAPMMVVAIAASAASAEVRTKVVEYKQGNTALEGFLAWDDAVHGPRPGVLVVHQWMGLTDYERMRARELAGLGYVAFAADIYGKGVRPTSTAEAGALAGKYKSERALLRARVNAGLDALRANPMVDRKRIAAIGYCFGGTAVLELGRSGADVAGIVTFHGGLDSPDPAAGKNIKAKVLVLHGADDPFNPAKDIAAFQQEMRSGGVDWQMIYYGGAVHSFTQKDAGNDPSKGAAYNERADRRSWQAMKDFFAEIFG